MLHFCRKVFCSPCENCWNKTQSLQNIQPAWRSTAKHKDLDIFVFCREESRGGFVAQPQQWWEGKSHGSSQLRGSSGIYCCGLLINPTSLGLVTKVYCYQTLPYQQGGLIYSATYSYSLIRTIRMVLRHSSTLHPHHLLAFAKFASDLRLHKQGENQSPQFQGETKQEGSSQKWLEFLSACIRKHLIWNSHG